MAKEVIERIKYTCDICKNDCTPIQKVSITMGHALNDPINIDLHVRADISYCSSTDVCQECLNKAMIKYLKDQGVEFK